MARILAQLGELVFTPLFLKPGWDRFPRHADSPIKALKLFLGCYAFEHAGSPREYALLAVEALKEVSGEKVESLASSGFSGRLWDRFCELLKGMGTFANGNPLNPRDGAHDVISQCLKLTDDHQNLFIFTRRAIENNRLGYAHSTLDRIRGIGPKIASLFLRDVAMVVKPREERLLNDRELLQPIDVWLLRTVHALTQNRNLNAPESAEELLKLADEAGCCALRLNAGSWYFGSQIALTLAKLDESLESPDALKRCIAEHRDRMRKEVELLPASF